ncbi:MAG: O-antigen ligase family protein [Desulfotomaculales bacterium]
MSFAHAYRDSRLSRVSSALRRFWHESSLARWLAGEPAWTAPDTLRSTALARALTCVFARLRLPAFRPAADASRALPFIAARAWLLLVAVMGYAVIDFALRSGPPAGGAAGFWDEMLLAAGLALLLARLACRGPRTYRYTELDIPILVYTGVFTFLFLVRSPETAVGLEGVRVYVQYVLWYFLAAQLCDRRGQAQVLAAVLVGITTLIAVYGIAQYVLGVEVPATWVDQAEAGVRTRVFSIVGSPNVLGSLLTMVLPLGLAGLLTASGPRTRAAYGAASAVMALCLLFTLSRGAWLACFAALLAFGLLYELRVLLALGAAALGVPVLFPDAVARVTYLFSSAYLASSVQAGRLARWQMAVERIKAHPLAGEGFGRFGGAVATRAIPGSFYVDNFYLKTAAEGGLIALGTLLWLFVTAVRAGYRAVIEAGTPQTRALAAAILGGLLGVLLHNAVENIFEVPMMATLFWTLLGLLVVLPRLPE